MNDIELTPFEKQIKEYFPEIFELHMLGKEADKGGGGEVHIWSLVQQLIQMNREGTTGVVFINYSKGRIDNVSKKIDILAFKGHRPGY